MFLHHWLHILSLCKCTMQYLALGLVFCNNVTAGKSVHKLRWKKPGWPRRSERCELIIALSIYCSTIWNNTVPSPPLLPLPPKERCVFDALYYRSNQSYLCANYTALKTKPSVTVQIWMMSSNQWVALHWKKKKTKTSIIEQIQRISTKGKVQKKNWKKN